MEGDPKALKQSHKSCLAQTLVRTFTVPRMAECWSSKTEIATTIRFVPDPEYNGKTRRHQ